MGILDSMDCASQKMLMRDMTEDFISLEKKRPRILSEYSSDSGMDDGAISPVSSIGSETTSDVNQSFSEFKEKRESPPVQSTLPVKPQGLTPSESSAFSKWTPTYPPTIGGFHPLCTSSPGLGYLPGFFISPWMADSFQRGFPLNTGSALHASPESSPSKATSDFLRSPGLPVDRMINSPEKQAFYHVDPRIPFTNYFMNLTKLFQKEENSENSVKDRSATSTSTAVGESERGDIKEERVHQTSTLSAPRQTTPSPKLKSEPADSDDNLRNTPPHMEIPPPAHHNGIPHMIPATESSQKNILHGRNAMYQLPASLDRLGTFPTLAPSSAMMPMMSGIGLPPNSGMFHPAFLQMAGMGGKRGHHPDKPTPVKKYKCDVCGKAFSRSNTLVTHKRIHTGDKPFKCEVCGRAFRQPGNLTRHRLTHTTVKPYVCPQCNKAFNRASNLHTHMRTHTNYKPFICPYCGKGFHQKIDMKIHCYTHTGERPHRCDVCGKGFTLASTLSTHRRIHFDARAFPPTHFTGTGSVIDN